MTLPGVGTVSGLHAERSSSEVFFSFTSFVDPGSSWSYAPATGDVALWSQNSVPGLDPAGTVVVLAGTASLLGTNSPHPSHDTGWTLQVQW